MYKYYIPLRGIGSKPTADDVYTYYIDNRSYEENHLQKQQGTPSLAEDPIAIIASMAQ